MVKVISTSSFHLFSLSVCALLTRPDAATLWRWIDGFRFTPSSIWSSQMAKFKDQFFFKLFIRAYLHHQDLSPDQTGLNLDQETLKCLISTYIKRYVAVFLLLLPGAFKKKSKICWWSQCWWWWFIIIFYVLMSEATCFQPAKPKNLWEKIFICTWGMAENERKEFTVNALKEKKPP